jgi:DNA-binding response OmpR family regulator
MKNILLIDDDRALRTTLSILLQRAGFLVVCAENGKEGLRLFSKDAFDLVVTDLIMPEMEGIETIMAIRRLAPNIKIIAMSGGARNSPAYLQVAGHLGANEVLIKPFEARTLVEVVRNLLGNEVVE